VSDTYTAHQSVEHDDLNVLCLGARVIGPELARELVRERHLRRLAEVAAIARDGIGAPSNRNHAA
jgi:ribose 5-phosphate isomerase B